MFTPPFILSIAGGGSTYTPGIVKSLMVRLQDFPLAEIRLYDIDEARQNTIAPVVEKVIRDHSQSITFTVTTDPEVAFSGAHFVFAQMRVGQYRMREQDEKIPLRHGVVGQETCGPGGLAYGLRTILPMVELIDLVDRYAHEKAWIVNYSNPAAIVAEGCAACDRTPACLISAICQWRRCVTWGPFWVWTATSWRWTTLV